VNRARQGSNFPSACEHPVFPDCLLNRTSFFYHGLWLLPKRSIAVNVWDHFSARHAVTAPCVMPGHAVLTTLAL
jgi:hypothetical protein